MRYSVWYVSTQEHSGFFHFDNTIIREVRGCSLTSRNFARTLARRSNLFHLARYLILPTPPKVVSSIVTSCLLFLNMTSSFRKVPQNVLGVSEPNPSWFGNPPNGGKGWTNENWLLSRFHFNFAEYHNPANKPFGILRVMSKCITSTPSTLP